MSKNQNKRPKLIETGPLGQSSKTVDPIHEAIAKFEAAAKAYTTSKDDDPQLEARFHEAEQELVDTPVCTMKGAARKLRYIVDQDVLPASLGSRDHRMVEQMIDYLSQS